MKGTLFSSDFIIDESNKLRLLELNTDTAMLNDILDTRLDFTAFISLLQSNNITKLTVVYKVFHRNFIEKLTSVIGNDATFITEIVKIEEDRNTIYPTNVTDEADRFILRLAYDENAIFDSTYCKQRIEVLKIFKDNDNESSVPEFRYSGSAWEGNTFSSSINASDTYPDIVEKDSSERHSPITFHKFVGTAESSSTEINDDYFNNYLDRSDRYIEKYHTTPTQVANGKVQAIRQFGILYGSEIEYVSLGSYKIDAMYDMPNISSLSSNTAVIDIPIKHYFEYTTNFVKHNPLVQDAVLSSEKLQKVDDSFVGVGDLLAGDNIKSFFLSGSPDTDDYDVFSSWSQDGRNLPDNSIVTSSVVETLTSSSLWYGTGIELTLGTGEEIYVSTNKNLLTYSSQSDEIQFKSAYWITASDDYLIDKDGDLLSISQSNIFIAGDLDTHKFYRIDVEDTDTFFVSSSSPFIVHNAPCFVAGTKVHIEEKGITNIEDVEVGDKVISYNHENDVVEYKEVKKVRIKSDENVVTYVFENGTELTGTPDHPLFVVGKGYSSYYPQQTKEDSGLDVEQILIGDEVLHIDGYGVVITDIIEEEQKEVVYNLDEVDGNNNFFVEDFLAHNRFPPGGVPGGGDPTCFAAGTEISLANGDTKNIEDIVIGDEVLGWDGEKIESSTVIAIDHSHTVESHADACKLLGDEPSLYTIDDTGIEFTPEHPFLTKDGWKSLVPDENQEPYLSNKQPKILQVGDSICVNSEWKEIEDIRIVRSDAKEKVYNITVDRLHSYIANGIIVHNK